MSPPKKSITLTCFLLFSGEGGLTVFVDGSDFGFVLSKAALMSGFSSSTIKIPFHVNIGIKSSVN